MSDNHSQQNEIIFYTTPDGAVHVEVFFQDESFWLSQKKMAELFGVEVNTINYRLKEIFKTAELQEDSVIRKIRITADDGKNYLTNFYNLDAIIGVGPGILSLAGFWTTLLEQISTQCKTNKNKNEELSSRFLLSRHNISIAAVARGSFIIGKKKLRDNLLPPQVQKKDGFILLKPNSW